LALDGFGGHRFHSCFVDEQSRYSSNIYVINLQIFINL
jgi:hypothetical protein